MNKILEREALIKNGAQEMKSLRNVAIIAHVDHGKTTLVDVMLQQSGVFHENEQLIEQVMDSNDLERERGITILAKNTAVQYGDIRINVVDTPGHADFSGEVERVLKMVDGVLLVVDAYDGPMPQTRFVLRKALEMQLKPIVVVNKIDRPDARPETVVDMVLDLFIELGANDEQIDFPVIFASAKKGYAFLTLPQLPISEQNSYNISPLLDTVCKEIPCPVGYVDKPLQMLVSNIDYDNYIGRIAVGRIERGVIKVGEQVVVASYQEELGRKQPIKISKLLCFQGLGRAEIEQAEVGEIVCLAGIEEINIGDTICRPDCIEALPFVDIDEPTIAMTFSVNNSPLAGKEGKFVTSRHLRARLEKETKTNVSMRFEETDTTEAFIIKGRGELHISILIETMRREGYEFQVSKPEVITKQIDGIVMEPEELLLIDVPEQFVGIVIEKLGERKAELINMLPPEKGYTRMEFRIPSRGLIGYRSEFLTDTKGNGIMNSIISGFEPWKGAIETRNNGVLVASEAGFAVAYALYHAQERGTIFISPGTAVYEGMIVGANPRAEDMTINVCKKKHASNVRASGSDDALRLVPPVDMSLEQCLEFVADDELIEVTPKEIRLRKRILNNDMRLRQQNKKKLDK